MTEMLSQQLGGALKVYQFGRQLEGKHEIRIFFVRPFSVALFCSG
jgi:hypothetical protein